MRVLTSSCSRRKQIKPTPRQASTYSADLVMEGFEDFEVNSLPRKNKLGLELTRCGRHSTVTKQKEVNEKYITKYRSPAKTETILGKLLPIGKACALIGTVMLGPKIPLEDAGHADRLRIFLSAKSIASTRQIFQKSSILPVTRQHFGST